MGKIRILLLPLLCLYVNTSKAQQADSLIAASPQLPEKFYSRVDKKLSSINDQLTKKSLKYLAKFQRQERKLQEKLQKLNPENVLANANEKYNELAQKASSKSPPGEETWNSAGGGEYNPALDSLATSFSFLKQFSSISDKVKEPLSKLTELQSKLQQSEKIKEFIAERKNQIKEILSKYTKLPAGLKKEYDKLRHTAVYYQMQVQEYKNMLKDKKKIEQKALTLLNKLPAFQKFMKENSQLASLFRLPVSSPFGGGQVGALTGLQTRSQVQSLIQQRIAAGGPNAQAQIQANLAAAHAELNKLKDKLLSSPLGAGGEMPDFKPNTQKTKPFLKRLEYTADVQFSKTNRLLPNAVNISLGAGYKLDDKKIIGINIAYKMGIGSIQHISFTHQGLGFRCYFDWKIHSPFGGAGGGFYASGGYEANYNAAFKNIEQLKNCNAWQRSALIGVSKKYKISKKVKGETKLLYDFLAHSHVPVSQTLIYRLGYSF